MLIAAQIAELLMACGGDEPGLRAGLDRLRREHSGRRLHLVAHRETFDSSVSYDVLVRGDGPALSVGVAGSAQLPWPLRGVVRADDQIVVRVNGHPIDMVTAAGLLEDVLDDPALLRHLVHAALIREALLDDPVELSAAGLQAASEAYRRAKGLVTAGQTRQWLAERGMTMQRFTELVTNAAELAALRDRVVTADRIEDWFAAHRGEYAHLTVAWAEGGVAGDDPVSSVLGAHAQGRDAGLIRCRASDIPEGAVVVARTEAMLDVATRALVADDVFTDWLEQRRAGAEVQWYWGDQARTARLT